MLSNALLVFSAGCASVGHWGECSSRLHSTIDVHASLASSPPDQPVTAARLRSGRALAYEGLSQWQSALSDYTAALDLAQEGGESPDAYIINAIGNCQNSLQQWGEARESYLTSSQLFQQAKVGAAGCEGAWWSRRFA
jgi:tetratricopeptide (TPR) repeat protein